MLTCVQARGVVDVIIKVGGVVHQRLLVMRERVIVMDLVMEVVMMDMLGVKEIFNVEATIAGSLVFISMRKMIVVKNLRPSPQCQTAMFLEHHWNLKKVRQYQMVIMIIQSFYCAEIINKSFSKICFISNQH